MNSWYQTSKARRKQINGTSYRFAEYEYCIGQQRVPIHPSQNTNIGRKPMNSQRSTQNANAPIVQIDEPFHLMLVFSDLMIDLGRIQTSNPVFFDDPAVTCRGISVWYISPSSYAYAEEQQPATIQRSRAMESMEESTCALPVTIVPSSISLLVSPPLQPVTMYQPQHSFRYALPTISFSSTICPSPICAT